MNKVFSSILILIFFAQIKAFAQGGAIKGRAIDITTRKGVEFAGAVLLSAKDSSVVKSVLTDTTGHFILPNISDGSYILMISSIEYHKKYQGPLVIGPAQRLLDVGEMPMLVSQRLLQGVEIVGQVPMFRNRGNGAVEVNVANTILATSNSVTEILSKSPNVVITDDGVSVFGKGAAMIYLNGRRITAEQLSAISTTQIKKLDIIPNPSSKYDAEGKAVINVVTVGNVDEGYKGTVKQTLTVSDYSAPNANTNLDVNYKKGKVALVGSYGLLIGKTREILNTTRSRQAPDNFRSQLQTDWKREYKNFSNYSLGAQYDINEKNHISTEYNGFYNNLGGTTTNSNAITSNALNGLFGSVIQVNNITSYNSLSINYNRNIDSLGSALFVGTQYSRFNTNANDHIDETSLIDGQTTYGKLNNKVGRRIDITSSQVDYTKAFNQNNKLDLGAKFSYAKTNLGSDFFVSKDGSDFVPDNGRSNTFSYKETTPAAYANFSGAINAKTNYGIGLRAEWTDYELITGVLGHEKIKDSYLNFFPSAFITLKVSDKTQIRGSYTSRITRPSYQALNPTVVYQDAFTTIEGNPYIKPERTHSFEIGATYLKYDFKIGYNYSISPITGSALQGKDANSYVLKAVNLSYFHSIYSSLSVPLTVDWWTSMNTVSLTYDKYISNDIYYGMNRSTPQLYVYSSNSFNINNLFRIQLLGWYQQDKYEGTFYRRARSLVAAGIEKDFFKRSLKANFMVNDIFRKDRNEGDYEVGKTYIIYGRVYNSNYFRFSLSYNFGQLKKNTYNNKSIGQSENNRAQ